MKRMILKAVSRPVFFAVIFFSIFLSGISGAQVAPLSCSIMQLTNTTLGDNINQAMSADGNRIAFVSNMDLVPGGNVDGNFEIFLYDVASGTLSQVTNTTGGGFGGNRPSLDGTGNLIVFESSKDLLPGSNTDGSTEVFLYDVSSVAITQITDTPAGAGSTFPLINADGTRIVFRSTYDFTGGNADGNDELFLYVIASATFMQVTDTTAGGLIYTSSISGDGTRIAFNTTRDLVPPGNADGNDEIFVYNTVAGSTTQITNTTGGGNYSPSISANGTRIAFVSYNNITGLNPDMNEEIFLYDTTDGSFTQITDTAQIFVFFDPSPSIDSAGTRIAFHSYYNINGGNPDGTSGLGNAEIYLAACPAQAGLSAEVPAMSPWGLAVFAFLAGGAAFVFLRRKARGRLGG